jgi:hypothetical protein
MQVPVKVVAVLGQPGPTSAVALIAPFNGLTAPEGQFARVRKAEKPLAGKLELFETTR